MVDTLFANDNKKMIQAIARKSFKANKTRNLVAMTAIFLTTLLFTSVFTVAGVLLHAAEQQNFRQSGGYAHGSFKEISPHDVEVLGINPLIERYGLKKMLGLMGDHEFAKNPTEVNFCDETYAALTYVEFIKGGLPRENTKEMACNTNVLNTLGIKPIIGSEITLTYEIDRNVTITDTFTLSGYWQSDPVLDVSFVYLPLSYVDKILAENPAPREYIWSGRLDMDISLASDISINKTMLNILHESGFQNDDPTAANYRSFGVNPAYNSAQASANMDIEAVIFIVILLLLFMFSGYLIIFNVFKISVANDIRFYGLLKTIGTTSIQLRKIIYRQALFLSVIGIPTGLLGGFILGHVIAPVIMQNLNVGNAEFTWNPYIFIGGGLFALATVLVSCIKPASIAGKVSPVDALRYTEISMRHKKCRKSRRSNSFYMALANMARYKVRTIIVVLSLSLSILVLQLTVNFTNGFDMNKYLSKYVVSDVLVGNVNYLNSRDLFNKSFSLTEEDISTIITQTGITDHGVVYGDLGSSYAFYSSAHFEEYLSNMGKTNTQQAVAYHKKRIEKLGTNENKDVLFGITLYGMDSFALEKINVFEGTTKDIQSNNGIVAIYKTDNYGKPKMNSNDKTIGDTITIRQVDVWAYFDIDTDQPIEDIENYEQGFYRVPVSYTDRTYEVVALATMKYNMGKRYSYGGYEDFILPSSSLKETEVNFAPINLLLNVDDAKTPQVELFLEQYTTKNNRLLNFESKQLFVNEFHNLKNSYLMVGILLSSIMGIVGMLNFFNVILTSITVRKKEFAILQSIGMTGTQLKTMLIWEGMLYIIITMLTAFILTFMTLPMFETVVSGMFWYFSSHFTLIPLIAVLPFFIVIGVFTPIIIYRIMNKQSIVEQLREVE